MGLSSLAGFIKKFATAQYALAVLAVAGALGLRLALDPILGSYSPYLPFVAAVLVAAYQGGRGPALAATGLSVLGCWYLFLEPRYSFAISDSRAAVGLAEFAVLGAAISLLISPGRSVSGRVDADRLELAEADAAGTSLVRRIAMAAGAALALGVLASLLWGGFTRSTEAERSVEHTYQVLNATASVRSSLERAQTSQRGYLLTGYDQYLQAYQSAVASERQARTTLRLLTSDNHVQQARLDEFNQLLRTRLGMQASAIEVRRQRGMAAAADLVRANAGKEQGDQLRAILDAADDDERRLLHSRTMAASAADSRTRWLLGLGSGSLVLLLFLAGAGNERHIHRRREAERLLARQAGLIDLSHDAIITADRNRAITGWNLGAQEMYGWTGKEAAGKLMHELLHTSSQISTAEVDGILAREGRWDGELVHTGFNGRQVVVESRQVLLRDAAGRPAGYLEVNRDISERKKADEALRESEAVLRSMFDSPGVMRGMIELIDGAIMHISCNAAAAEMYGIEEQPVSGKTPAQTGASREVIRTWIALYEECRRTGKAASMEYARRDAKGKDRWLLATASYLGQGPSGNPRFAYNILDLTERKRAEEALAASEEKFAKAFAINPTAVSVIRRKDGVFLDVNETWEEVYGFSRDEAIERSTSELGVWPTPEDRLRCIREQERSGTLRAYEQTFVRATGERFPSLLSATTLTIGGEEVILSSVVDITERKQAQEALRESEAQFRTLANAIPQLCWMANADGWIFWYNERWYEYTGTTPEQMEGWGWQSVHDPEALPKVLERWKVSIAEGKPFDMVFPLRGADGVFRPFLTRIMPVRGRDGQVVRWFGTNTDISEQRKIEEALRESRAELEAALASMTDAVFISDAEGRLTHNNEAFATYHRFRNKEECSKSIADCPGTLTAFLSDGTPAPPDMWALPRALRGERVTNTEYTLQRKDTGETWVGSYSFGPIRGADGAIVGSVVVARDVTDRKRVEEALRLSEEKFAKAFAINPAAITITRLRDGVYMDVNETWEAMTGYTRAEVIGRSGIDLHIWPSPEDRARSAEKLKAKGALHGLEETLLRKSGEPFVALLTATTLTVAGEEVLLSAWLDITDRKRAEEALRESEGRLAFALGVSQIGHWDLDLVNQQAHRSIDHDRIFGYAEMLPEWTYEMFLDHLLPEDRERVDRTFQAAMETKGNWNFEGRIRRADGAVRWIWACGQHHRDETGAARRLVGIVQDITERKEAEEAIRLLNAELERRVLERTAQLESANKELEAFAYSVSHDLRAPLRGIDGWTLALVEDICGECEKLNGKGRGYLDRVRSETQRMGRLIDDLLQLSRIGRAEMNRQRVDLSRTAESIAARLREAHPGRRLEFVIRPGLKASGDARLLEVALTNLLENAVKFTGTRADTHIEFDTAECQGGRAFVVRDNGVGFNMAYAGTLFGAFQRLHSDSEFPGTGIGLATVQRVIHRHGGRIWAEAEPDRGANFYFTLGS